MSTGNLKYAKYIKREFSSVALRATDVLYEKMHVYNNEAKEILNTLITAIKSNNLNSPALKQLYQLMAKTDDIVIDCAAKLAPYQSPRLEAVEVRNKVEHRFVLRAPQQIKSVEEWMEKTGADILRIEDRPKGRDKVEELKNSGKEYNFDIENDEINTNKQLLN